MRVIASIFIFSAFLIFSACDNIEDPYDGSSGPVTGGVDGIPRKVLVEDFTGFKCPNCPLAAATAAQLQDQVYGDQMINVGIHIIDFFAEPGPDPDHPGAFEIDLRTPAGLDYENEFGFQTLGIPNGMINRTRDGPNILIGFGAWDGMISSVIDEPADIAIKVKEVIFNNGTDEIEVDIDLIVANSISGDYNITLYLVEDSVIAGQYDGSNIVDEYLHRHVLRGALNGSWGDPIFTDPLENDSIHFEGSFSLPASLLSAPAPNPDIDISKCEIIAYVYNAGFEEYEIIQVEEAHVEVQ